MKSKFLALGLIMLIGLSLPLNTKAAVCKQHQFSSHQSLNHEYYVSSSHQYKYTTVNGNDVYKTCNTKVWYTYCMYKCSYCGTIDNASGTHGEYRYTEHSVNH